MVIIFVHDQGKDRFDHAKELITLLLPVFGTWIGIVLAFYFSKESMENSSMNLKTLVDHVADSNKRPEDMLTRDVMLTFPSFTFKYVTTSAEFEALPIQGLIDMMQETGTERLPIIVKGQDTFHFLIYRGTLERYLLSDDAKTAMDASIAAATAATNAAAAQAAAAGLPAPAPIAPAPLTIKDLQASTLPLVQEVIKLGNAQPFVSINSKVGEVQDMLKSNMLVQDVLVTETGSKKEKVLGWVTDSLIAERTGAFKK